MKAIASLFSNCKPKEFLANFFIKANEPKIIFRRNNHGDVYFKVYDPQTKWTGTFSSEQEVRILLEERYYSIF
jgi:hypothetical protein